MNRTSKVLFAAIFVICSAGYCSASDIYVAQSSAGVHTGADCADARTLSSLAAGDWVAGNTIHLCGTITAAAGASGLVAQGSGTSASPIIVKFESNAILEAPYFGGGDASGGSCYSQSSCAAGINLYGFSNIIVDGGTNGVIENTANGSDLAYQYQSNGIGVGGDSNIIIRNITVQNTYVNDPVAEETSGQNTRNIDIGAGATNITVCNSTLNNARTAIESPAIGATVPVYPLPSCASNIFLAGMNYFGNAIYDHCWAFHLAPNSSSIYNVFTNDVNIGTKWVLANGVYHTDGIFAYGVLGSAQTTVYAFNNYFHGPFVGTGEIYCNDVGGSTGCSAYIFNNIFVQDASVTQSNNQAIWLVTDPSPDTDGPYYVYNNTIAGYGYEALLGPDSGPIVTFNNNLTIVGSEGQILYFKGYGTAALPTILAASDYNSFYGTNNPFFKGGGQTTWCWSQNGGSPSSCTGGNGPWVNTGFDTHSVRANPQLNSSYQLSSGSPDIGAGANLSSLCSTPGLGPLCYDKNGVARPSTGAWDIGAYEAPRPNPPVGLTGTVK